MSYFLYSRQRINTHINIYKFVSIEGLAGKKPTALLVLVFIATYNINEWDNETRLERGASINNKSRSSREQK